MKRREQTMEAYEAPVVEVIEVEVERGFSITGSVPNSDDSEFGNSYSTY